MSVTVVDVLLVLVVLFGVWQGWHRGLLLGLLDLVRWVGGLLFALRFYQPVARWMGPRVSWDEAWDEPAAFLLTAVAAGLVIQLLGQWMLGRVSEATHRGTVNRTLGMIPGLAGGLISAAILASLLMAAPLPEAARESARQSAFADRLTSYTNRFEDQLAPVFNEAIQRTLNRLTIRPESNERVELGFKVESVRARPDLEAQMLELVNAEREAAGLGRVAPVSPDGLDPFDRMRRAGVNFRAAGENLALAPTVRVAHTGLMNSPGHRANILQPSFGRLGVGIVDGGYRGIMVSQEFRN